MTGELCPLCRRARGFHRHGRWCGPLTGTAPGPMTDTERGEYQRGWDEANHWGRRDS